MPADIVILDTEFTAWQGSTARNWRGPGELREIIQVGAIRLDTQTLQEIGSFSVFIRPSVNQSLSGYITALTRITNERLDAEGITLAEALASFSTFAGDCRTYCYGRDDLIVAENARLLGIDPPWPGKPAINLRPWLTAVGIPLAGIHSGDLAAHVGARSAGLAHDALVDARSLAEAVRYLVARGAPGPFGEDLDPRVFG